jgi:hypothetical protein
MEVVAASDEASDTACCSSTELESAFALIFFRFQPAFSTFSLVSVMPVLVLER